MERVLILTADSNTGYPVPATKGGAVSELVENILFSNEQHPTYKLELLSIYDEKAEKKATNYNNTKFYWSKTPFLITLLDSIIFHVMKFLIKDKSNSFKSMLTLIFYIFNARKLIKETNYDKIIIENNMLLFWAVVGQKKCKGKYYYHVHNLPRTNAFLHKTLKNVNKILAVSEFLKSEIVNGKTKFPVIDEKKVVVLHNRIDLKHFCPIEKEKLSNIREKFNIKKGDSVLLYAGRLSWEKGVDKVLDSFSLIPDNKNIKILIVGNVLHGNKKNSSKYLSNLKRKVNFINTQVVFTGYVSYEEMPLIYNIADLSILPSMWEEPAGLTMIESMACGVPVITTNSGGIPEYVDGSAIILKRDNYLVKEIATNTYELLNNMKLYNFYKLSGLNRTKKFDCDSYILELNKSIN